ncbi:bifunctional nicotinamidase/pyrazinamidase [Dyella sp.]|uniref:bifunctional nicotinamidase/pyrazinamidase n=1 Tax=Dyella sp. TaxID=1869338 RepID=UPI002B470A4D|nr:bifunctional nicotinamidase/pyrazinamidase [Dyella sp.]HKT27189.1 bifunctional nicotinamidase/pyrazinamidase [Dyella sp.]
MHPQAALIVVDVQPDFMPGGALACHEGDAIVPGIDRLLRQRLFGQVVATQDWHPRGHVSFASTHAGKSPFEQIPLYGHPQTLWPDHCVQDTPGAALHPDIDWSPVDLILRKGSNPAVDSYSAFQENHGPDRQRPRTGLAGWLKERGVSEVYAVGLARDVCVLWTVQDALAAGFRARVIWDLTRPVTSTSDGAMRARLLEWGVGMVDSANLG